MRARRVAVAGMVALLSAALLPAAMVLAAAGTVTNCAGDTSAGSLRATVTAAASGDTISFTLDCSGANRIALGATVSITGKTLSINGAGHAITIDGSGLRQLFAVAADGNLTLAHLDLANGFSTTGGGAIYNNGTMVIDSTTIYDNSTNSSYFDVGAGAIYNLGTLAVNGSSIYDNSAAASSTYGGGIFNNGTLTIGTSSISNNAANRGGGIYNEYGSLTIAASTISGNSAASDSTGYGGGIVSRSGTTNITRLCDQRQQRLQRRRAHQHRLDLRGAGQPDDYQ